MRVSRALQQGLTIVLAASLLSGCATTSVFNPYPNQALAYKAAISQGTIDSITPQLAVKAKSQDKLLYLCESGRLHQLNKQFEASKDDFAKALAVYQADDDKARISASALAADATSLLSNDNAIPYSGYGFERIFVHHFQALNYLALKDVDGASVELRRASLEQRVLEQQHDKEISKVESSTAANNFDVGSWDNNPEFAGMNAVAGKVKSSFQNAYTFYTSAVIWEAQGEINDALVDYKKALEINPNNSQIKQDIQRLSKGQRLGKNQGALVVLYEDGFVPARSGIMLSLPDFQHGTYLNIAFPYYATNLWYQPQPLTVYSDNHRLGQTAEIADVAAMAVKALIEEAPAILLRQLLRARAKYELHQQASKDGNVLGSFVTTLYNMASEQADLRNWLTLPNNAQILRAQLAAGEQSVELALGGSSRSVNVTIAAGRITLLRVVNANNRLLVQHFNL